MQKFTFGIIFLAVSACSQNPQFKINSANQVYGSLNELEVLLATAGLGALNHPTSFENQVDIYATVIGGFEVGRQSAVVSTGRTSTSKKAALDALDADISRCISDLKQMALQHRTTGLAPGSAIIQATRTSCNTAARAVAANESAALVVQTAAGDL